MLNGGSANARSTDPASSRRSPSTQSPRTRRSAGGRACGVIVGPVRGARRGVRPGAGQGPRSSKYPPRPRANPDSPLDGLRRDVVDSPLRQNVGGTRGGATMAERPPPSEQELEVLKVLWD